MSPARVETATENHMTANDELFGSPLGRGCRNLRQGSVDTDHASGAAAGRMKPRPSSPPAIVDAGEQSAMPATGAIDAVLMVNADTAASMLGISRTTLDKLVREGKVRRVKLAGRVLFSIEHLRTIAGGEA